MLMLLTTIIGAYSIICWIYENLRTPFLLLLKWIQQQFEKDRQDLFSQKYGSWAVITGSSDGIGKGYASYLASQGMKVLLVARNESKLKRVAEEITAKHGLETRIFVADFSKGEEIYDKLAIALNKLDIGILVNNVGIINEKPIQTDKMERRLMWDLININVGAATLLCNIVIPSMKQRKRGLIINVSSLSSLAPTPYLNVYAATKAYITSFSLALHEELAPYGIECQTVSPGFVHTSMTDYLAPANGQQKSAPLHLVKVNDMIRYAGFTIAKVDQTTGHWSHGVQTALLKALPLSLRLRVYAKLYTYLLKKHSTIEH
ncbi:inactive hydroxysteroid dehydrogenase-like protein 1 [Anopheles nili]|uniref:inactive hydroxysteroid dehydrogenase-like protein 1 n=1 Tax=Anopheles nili TaxID=185578 RepID=UPI00237B1413|nr:inactive hydroxysteroid dehydrogenase-like protein 1 [Anopheles nili]